MSKKNGKKMNESRERATVKELEILLNYFENTKVFLTYLTIKRSRIDISIPDLMNELHFSRKTIEKIVDRFVEDKLVIITRKIGKTVLYALNPELTKR